MGQPRRDSELRVMPWWFILVGLLFSVVVGWLVLGWLLGEADRAGQPEARAQLRVDAIRTALTVVAGTGGGVALLLAARRQWINERAQRHQEMVAARDHEHRERVQSHAEAVVRAQQRQQESQVRAAEHDAVERRTTELYTKAVDLLGSDQAAVRLGGLYALERLAQDNERQRATIVGVVCAYLRMRAPADDPHETEVRRTAQRVLTRHLNADDEVTYWSGVRLELAGARLVDFDVNGCTLVDADFSGADFVARTTFAGARIVGSIRLGASFGAATFDGLAGDGEIVLDDAQFSGDATFERACFGGTVSCRRARFAEVSFAGATFARPVSFDATHFGGGTSFRGVVFAGGLSIEHAEFARYAGFRTARFDDMAMFRWTVFGQEASFERATFDGAANFGRAEFHGAAGFEGATLARRPLFEQARAAAAVPHRWPPGAHVDRLDDDWLVLTDSRSDGAG